MILTLFLIFVFGALPFLSNFMKYVFIGILLIMTFIIENKSLLNTGKKEKHINFEIYHVFVMFYLLISEKQRNRY